MTTESFFTPAQLYRFSSKCIPWLMLLSLTLLVIAWGWGVAYTPADKIQNEGFRLLYFHVPAAMWSLGIYIIMAIFAFITLVWQNKLSELMMMAMAPIGAVFTFIALFTGSIWGAMMWGTWWEWDARMTSELILFFLYLGVLGLYYTFDNRQSAGHVVAILVIVGVINIPIIHYSVDWWHTLHQVSTKSLQSINEVMRPPLRIGMLAYFLLFLALTFIRFKTLLLQNSIRRGWCIEKLLIAKEHA